MAYTFARGRFCHCSNQRPDLIGDLADRVRRKRQSHTALGACPECPGWSFLWRTWRSLFPRSHYCSFSAVHWNSPFRSRGTLISASPPEVRIFPGVVYCLNCALRLHIGHSQVLRSAPLPASVQLFPRTGGQRSRLCHRKSIDLAPAKASSSGSGRCFLKSLGLEYCFVT